MKFTGQIDEHSSSRTPLSECKIRSRRPPLPSHLSDSFIMVLLTKIAPPSPPPPPPKHTHTPQLPLVRTGSGWDKGRCVCVCVCARARMCVFVCVCVWERERERERETHTSTHTCACEMRDKVTDRLKGVGRERERENLYFNCVTVWLKLWRRVCCGFPDSWTGLVMLCTTVPSDFVCLFVFWIR